MAVGLQSLLRTVVDNKASGLHIRGNSNAYVRLNGQIKPIDDSFVSNDDAKKMAYACMGERERKIFEQYSTVDFSLDAKSYGRFRFNVFRQMGKICMAIRHIPLKIPTFEEFHLPGDILRKIAENRRGLILVTGMTGSGKTSTLAAMIDHINKTRAGHILTIEDPIEFMHTDNHCIVSQLELGVDTPSYTGALRAAMRQDPDVVLIGELRDAEVMKAAIGAAETGQLVLGTMHTVNVTQTLARLVDAFPVLGTGTVLIPWALVCFIQGEGARAVGLLGLYAVAALTRSAMEPKLLGQHLGLDPLTTLLALYAGYRFWGLPGMLLSPLLAVMVRSLLPTSGGSGKI